MGTYKAINLFDIKAFWNRAAQWHMNLVFIKPCNGEKTNIKSKEKH